MTPCYQVRTSKIWIYPEMYLYYIFSGETVLKKTRRGSRYSLWEKIAIDWTLNMENPSLTQFSCQNVQCGCVCSVTSVVSDSVTLWTTARQTLLPIGFSRQEYWSGLTFPSPRVTQGLNPLVSPALVGGFFTLVPSGKPNDKNRDWNSGFFLSTSISRSRLREFSEP